MMIGEEDASALWHSWTCLALSIRAPREVYDRLDVPVTAIGTSQQELDAMPNSGYVCLTVGEGRFGLEWLKRIDLPGGRMLPH
jgi:hypothetical protein